MLEIQTAYRYDCWKYLKCFFVFKGNRGGQCNPFSQRAWSVLREKQASIIFWIACIESDFFSSVGRVEFLAPSWYLVFIRRRHLAMNSGSFGTCSKAVKRIFLWALKSFQASWAISNLLACLGIRSLCGQRKPLQGSLTEHSIDNLSHRTMRYLTVAASHISFWRMTGDFHFNIKASGWKSCSDYFSLVLGLARENLRNDLYSFLYIYRVRSLQLLFHTVSFLFSCGTPSLPPLLLLSSTPRRRNLKVHMHRDLQAYCPHLSVAKTDLNNISL